uniref:Solute carrier family 22 member 4-like n=1 Tax=Sinocyclocheilus anshuiensis TaxID=1608454 RepID=A0A671L424_9TELE
MGNYDEDTAFLGQKGPFFVILFFLLNAVYISTGLHSLYIVFVGASPSHHCRIADGNLSEEWLKASIPNEMVNGKLQPSQCWRYSLETVRKLCALGYSPLEVNLTDITLETCVDGWSYSTEIYHSTIVSEWDLVCDSEWRVPFASSTLYMGYLLGSLVSGQLSDRFGRRKVFFMSLVAEALVILAQSFSDSWLLFCVLYFFVGTVQISLYITAFVLGSEVLSKSLRVFFTTLGASLHYCIGYMVLPWIAFAVRDWRSLLRVLSGLTVVYIPLWWLIPESPRWLLSQGRVLESETIMREAAKKNKVSAPAVIFSESENSKYSVLDVLRTRDIRKTTFLCLLLWMAINIGYFGLSLNTSNLSGDPFLNCFLSALTEVPAYMVSTLLLKSCPRRPVLSAFLVIGGGFLLLLQLIPESKSSHTQYCQNTFGVDNKILLNPTEERVDAEFLLSLVSENRFILTFFKQNIISINSPPNYVILGALSVPYRAFTHIATQSLWELLPFSKIMKSYTRGQQVSLASGQKRFSPLDAKPEHIYYI